jgi:glycosyltransferase involved in cell wall biosynthesis
VTGAPRPPVRVHVASINTAAVTELCIRSMRRLAGAPFELVVGDCGSTDGSIEMLERFAADGWLELEVAPGGRRHAAWLDQWFAACPTRYALFVDSDVEFLRAGWLREMLDAAAAHDAALVATRIQAVDGVPYRHPVSGAARLLAARPEPWLLLLDVERLRGRVTAGFAYRDEPQPDAPGGKVAYDVGAAFFRDVRDQGLTWVEMPPAFAAAYHHFGGLSWQRGGRGLALGRRVKQALKRARVARHLRRERRLAGA